LLGPGTAPIDCLVVDLSAGGACLELPRDHKLPDKFDFLHGRSRRTSYLVWRSGFRIGLSYEGLKTRSGISDGLSRTGGLSRLSRGR